ncbi:DUF4846 domain-containing protein [Pollutibacter soli]|uniref:DUF4846 domain-containing protein n=1 Tax=Pollutibacter soli TaxID=3034157 RepID=UPI0030135596
MISLPGQLLFLSLFLSTLLSTKYSEDSLPGSSENGSYAQIKQIPAPEGFYRPSLKPGEFGYWLRHIELKKDNTVYLFNGLQKANQSAQFAVLDISVGDKNLQQCADAVMRLRAEWLRSINRRSDIVFYDNNRKAYRYNGSDSDKDFKKYLEYVYSWCGTASLEKQLHLLKSTNEISPGDVIIQGGSPGHAVIIVDVAENRKGDHIFLLAQSYMPAQDIHILRNPVNSDSNPWYSLSIGSGTVTPEWNFPAKTIRTW